MAYATVVLTGHYENVDGTPALGWVRITPTARQVIDASGDVILTGDSLLRLVNGAFSVTLPATDDPTLTPSSFGYTVTVGILESTGRASHILGPITFPLPSNVTSVDMADVTPSDISPPVVPDAETKLGAQAKADQAEAAAKAYTDQEIASLDLSGAVDSVNGKTGTVVLGASDVGADPAGTASGLVGPLDARVTTLEDAPASIPATEKGAPSGVASLGTDGLVPSSQLPATTVTSGVSSVNGLTGDVTLGAADVFAISTGEKGAANGVATLGTDGKVPTSQLPTASGGSGSGGGAVFVRAILSSSFTTTALSAVPITGLNFTITPPSNGVLTISGRANFQNSLASNTLFVGSAISPAPSAGSAQKWTTSPQPVANSWLSIALSGSWQVVGGTTYTVQVSVQKSAGGTLTVDSNADYTELTGVFVPA